jgi:xylose dehydrogenase (NAD/NADP)
MAEKVRYGLLSTARIGRNAHVPAALKVDEAEIVALSSRDRARAQQYAEELGIPCAYGSYEELLRDPEIDAVINVLPISMHCEWTIRAAEAGKHVLCEKPFATTVAEARTMIEAAAANGVLLMEAFTHRYLPQQAFVRRAIAAGEIGEVRAARAELVYTIHDWDADTRASQALGGGSLMDAGCYCVSQLRLIMGAEPLRVQAAQRIKEGYGVDATFLGLLEFPGGRLAYLCTSMEQPFRGCCEVIGTEGRIEMPSLFGGEQVVVTAGGEERVQAFAPFDRFAAQLAHFTRCVQGREEPLFPVEDALRNTAVLAALKRAAQEGRSVSL